MSNNTDSILTLLKGGIVTVTFGLNPEGQPYVQAFQRIPTGFGANLIEVQHQRTSPELEDSLLALAKDIQHCSKLSPTNSELGVVPEAN